MLSVFEFGGILCGISIKNSIQNAMMVSKKISYALIFLFVSGCNIEVDVPEGGKVVVLSKGTTCTDKKRCVISADNPRFYEKFRAVADVGYRFKGWKKSANSICGGKRGLCEAVVKPSTGALDEFSDALLKSSQSFSLEPEFEPDGSGPDAARVLFDDALSEVLDEGLRTCLQENRTVDADYADELLSLLCSHKTPVRKLAGIEGFSSLSSIEIFGSRISNLRPLAKLKFLHSLNLRGNRSRTYQTSYEMSKSGANKLTQLTSLGIENYNIQDATGLSGLSSLIDLQLTNNPLNDLEFLSGLPGLYHLELVNNNISDIGPVAGLPSLTSITLSDNNITDLSPLQDLEFLYLIQINGNPVRDISMLSKLKNLDLFGAAGAKITNISVLKHWPRIRVFWINGNMVSDISPLKHTPNLEELDISENPVVDTSVLNIFTGLNSFGGGGIGLDSADVEFLARNPSLRGAGLGLDSADIQFLANNPNLKRVLLGFNNILDWSAFHDLENLSYVNLIFNPSTRLEDNFDGMKSGELHINGLPLNCADIQAFMTRKSEDLTVVYVDACVP